jgi:co-chaperonin GroES (HSP10)
LRLYSDFSTIQTMNNTEPVIGQLHPLNGCVLVELKQSSKNFNVKEGKYDSRTEGIVISVPDVPLSNSKEVETFIKEGVYEPTRRIGVMNLSALIGKRIHFEEFKEGARIKRNGKIYSFIKIEDIRGYEDEQTD